MGHYLEGAANPVGGAASIARGLVPVIEAAGGSVRAGTPVSEILLEDGKAVGVCTRSGEDINAPFIVSAIGVGETVKHLLPEEIREQRRAREIATFKPSFCHFDVFLGFDGDIARHGATRSNHWFYGSRETNDAIWSAADDGPGRYEPWNRRGAFRWHVRGCGDRSACLPETQIRHMISILSLGKGCSRCAQTQQRSRDGSSISTDQFGLMAVGKLVDNAVMPR